MEAKPPDSWPWISGRMTPTTEYRVTIWEQPEMEDIDPKSIGWGEITFDLTGVEDVHEAVEWAERQLAANEGPYSRGGTPVRDREYVLYVRVPNEDLHLQIAGWDPTRNPSSENLRRIPRSS